MATVPSFESLLLEIHQSLGCPPDQTKVKDKFSNLGMPAKKHAKMRDEVSNDIFDSLEMDEAGRSDARQSMVEWEGFHKAVELETWTSNADQRQVLWHLLGYSYVPALARRIAFWNLESAFDKGMPGGKFWFLPHVNATSGKMELPVPQVIDWLIDLLGTSIGQAKDGLGNKKNANGYQDSIEKSLGNWKNGLIPRTNSLRDYFPEGATLDFKGVFEVEDSLANDVKFTAALAFIQSKKLSVDDLRDQIPMTQAGRLEAVLDQSASDDEKLEFVRLLLTRYAKPSMGIIRQRLLVARMVQDGYRRLRGFLCPDVKDTCTDPSQNKLLQLAGIFGTIYNLTVDAWKNSDTRQKEDIRFESRLAPWDKAGIFLSILPSLKNRAYTELAELLTRRLAKLADGDALEDLVGLDIESAPAIIAAKCQRLKDENAENVRIHGLIDRIRTKSPWRALQSEASYAVVSQVATSDSLPAKTKLAAIKRLRELAATPSDMVGASVMELAELLNCAHKDRPKDAQSRVETILTKAKVNSGYESWKAPLLQYRAKHLLAQNKFEDAAKLMRAALEACSERNFGTLRGEIARDALAIEVTNQGLIPGNHQKYHRNMTAYGMFPEKVESLEDTALWASDYFWDDLYKPYPGMESMKPLAKKQTEAFIGEALPIIFEGDWDAMKVWMKRHAKTLRQGTIREVRANTVLMAWLKMLGGFSEHLPMLRAKASSDLQGEVAKMEGHLANWRDAIHLLVEAWPKQVNIADFKGQSPLMMVADASDEQLVRVFLETGADINAQDYLGRTALHAAVTARSANCVTAILKYQPDTNRVTLDEEQTALHTAVRMGDAKIVRLLLAHESGLALRKNSHNQIALKLAQYILADLPKFRACMATQRRRPIGSKQDFEEILAMLSDATPQHIE
ncbi:MAG: ankyrin repeat domain-containing protein [Glaciimonas sp.]|nr:ankyrin repeat domain-containing protein [Glaciimonas sp.]